jgi:hypothetical protein
VEPDEFDAAPQYWFLRVSIAEIKLLAVCCRVIDVHCPQDCLQPDPKVSLLQQSVLYTIVDIIVMEFSFFPPLGIS